MTVIIKNHVTLAEKAKKYATDLHAEKRQKYDGRAYSHHLSMVVSEIVKYRHLLEGRYKFFNLVAAAWLHDTLEDCAITYNDLKDRFGLEVAEIVFAVTNEKGRTRKERNDKTYPGIRALADAQVIKVADRLANTKYSLGSKNKMYYVYKNEYLSFKQGIYVPGTCDEMWAELEGIYAAN